MLDLYKTEIIIMFFKFLFNFIILKLLNYPSRIQNRNSNYFFLISFKFYIFKTSKYTLSIHNRNHN